ncbi:MAG: hypothetical protein FWB85_12110 [Chitinispirillia bacterium]|nr:hypothetical protein [Chitinispirillia bacterium]MCL2242811.1 hypothetical protein [Chitinispirillia bacterium]
MEGTDYIDLEPEAPVQFRCFDRWYRFEIALFMLFGPVLFALWGISVWYYSLRGHILGPLFKYAATATILYFIARIVYRHLSGAGKDKTIVIDGLKVSKRDAGRIDALDLSEVSGIRLPRPPFTRRWMIFESAESKGTFLLSVYVRNGHKMVDRIFRILEGKGLRFDGAALLREKLYDAARRYNILQKLRAKQLHSMFGAASAVALLNMAAILLFWEYGPFAPLMALCWGFTNFFLQAAAYFIVEKAHLKKLLKSGEKADDGAPFTGYYILAGIFALLAGMAAGILVPEPEIFVPRWR